MNKKDQQILMAIGGALLIAFGHRLMDAELGKVGAPHVVGALVLATALQA